MGAGIGYPRGARVIHHGAAELLIRQDSVPVGKITLPIQEGTQYTHLWAVIFLILSMWGEQFSRESRSHLENEWCWPIGLVPEECYWSGPDEAPNATREDYRGTLRDINGYSPITQPPLKIVKVWLQVDDERRRLAGRGYDSRVERVEG